MIGVLIALGAVALLIILPCLKVSSRCSREEEAAGLYDNPSHDKSPAPVGAGDGAEQNT